MPKESDGIARRPASQVLAFLLLLAVAGPSLSLLRRQAAISRAVAAIRDGNYSEAFDLTASLTDAGRMPSGRLFGHSITNSAYHKYLLQRWRRSSCGRFPGWAQVILLQSLTGEKLSPEEALSAVPELRRNASACADDGKSSFELDSIDQMEKFAKERLVDR